MGGPHSLGEIREAAAVDVLSRLFAFVNIAFIGRGSCRWPASTTCTHIPAMIACQRGSSGVSVTFFFAAVRASVHGFLFYSYSTSTNLLAPACVNIVPVLRAIARAPTCINIVPALHL